MLKTQIMTMTMMKRGQGDGQNDIMMILYSMIMISVIEWIFRNIPIVAVSLTEFAKPHVNTWISERRKAIVPKMLMDQSTPTQKPLNSITLCRNYAADAGGSKGKDESNPLIEKVDAVLDHICSLDNAHHIRMETRVSLNTEREIALSTKNDLTAKVRQFTGTNENRTEILLTSRDLSVTAIRAWIDEVHDAFAAEKNNKLGTKLFYFEEIGGAPEMRLEMGAPGQKPTSSYKWEAMPRALTFSMTEFKTNKSFTNVYGHHVDDLRERLDLFLNHPEWYEARGLPHTLSFLLSGITGAGKTSTFKSISKDTRRHPIIVRLRPYTTQQQLKNLFFNETLVVQTADGQKQTLKIPLHKRFIIFEDIDCSSDVVLDREMFPLKAPPEGDAVTLDFLLNLFDGILERPNCLVGASANFVDRLDRALIRPGRFDVRIHFGHVDLSYLKDMFTRFYELPSLDGFDIGPALADIFTPAEVIECMCNHYKNPMAALKQLQQKMRVIKDIESDSEDGEECKEIEDLVAGGACELPGDSDDVVGGDSCPSALAHNPSLSGGVAVGSCEMPSVAVGPSLSGEVAGVAVGASVSDDSASVAGSAGELPDLPDMRVPAAPNQSPSFPVNPTETPPPQTTMPSQLSQVKIAGFEPPPRTNPQGDQGTFAIPYFTGNPSQLQQKQLSATQAAFMGFSGGLSGGDDLWSSPMFEDAKPPPGAPPFTMAMFAGSTRSNTDLNPLP